VGKPNEREKDLLSSFKKVYYSSKLTISSQGKIPHSPNKQSQKFFLEKHAKSVQLYDLQIYASENVPNKVLYNMHSTTQQQQEKPKTMPRFPCQTGASKIVPFLMLHGFVWYDPATEKWYSTADRKYPWDLCPFSLWEMCPLKLLTFLSQAYSENLSKSTPLVFSGVFFSYP
jgi:hypothetical protein